MTVLSREGYVISKKEISKNELEKIRDDLTIVPKVLDDFGKKNEEEISYEIFKEDNDNIYVPRHYGVKKFGIANEIKLDKGKKINIKFKKELRDYQIPIVEKLQSHIKKHGGGVLTVPCGRGKTAMAIRLISLLQRKTLVVVHKRFLMNQWIRQLKKFTNAKVGIIQRNKIDIEDKDVVVCMLKSLSIKDYPQEIFKEFGFTIADECHHQSAKINCRSLPKIVTAYTLGLSATPDRSDGTSKVFYWYIGSTIYREETKKNENVYANIYKFETEHPNFKQYWSFWQKRPDRVKTITKLTQIESRNKFIVQLINNIRKSKEKRKILVLSDRIEHLNTLEKMVSDGIERDKLKYNNLQEVKEALENDLIKLKNEQNDLKNKNANSKKTKKNNDKEKNSINKYYNEVYEKKKNLLSVIKKDIKEMDNTGWHQHTTGFYIGKMKEAQLSEAEDRDVIFGSFSMASEGLDIEALNTIILASPKSDVIQPVGRILRLIEYDCNPLIIDIADKIKMFDKTLQRREEYYAKSHYKLNYYQSNDKKTTFEKKVDGKDIKISNPNKKMQTMINNQEYLFIDE